MTTLATITITITVDSPSRVASNGVRVTGPDGASQVSGSAESEPDAIRAMVMKMKRSVMRRWVRVAAEQGLGGRTVTVNDALLAQFKDLGIADGVALGGAIGQVAAWLRQATGNARWPLERISQNPSVWRMNAADAEVVLQALDDSE